MLCYDVNVVLGYLWTLEVDGVGRKGIFLLFIWIYLAGNWIRSSHNISPVIYPVHIKRN